MSPVSSLLTYKEALKLQPTAIFGFPVVEAKEDIHIGEMLVFGKPYKVNPPVELKAGETLTIQLDGGNARMVFPRTMAGTPVDLTPLGIHNERTHSTRNQEILGKGRRKKS